MLNTKKLTGCGGWRSDDDDGDDLSQTKDEEDRDLKGESR